MVQGLECVKCKKDFFDEQQKELDCHHLIPKFMGGSDADGRVYLCKKCHDILHHLIAAWIWKHVSEIKKPECKKTIKNMSLWWINKND